MPAKKLKEFLDAEGVPYESIGHPAVFTAQEIAASAHISGKELAKTVMVAVDDDLAMAVLQASRKVDLNLLKEVAGAHRTGLADEADFEERFPGCEIGAMPPFGNLYGMKVFVDAHLREDEQIAFNAGTHTELIKMSYADFETLTQPTIGRFSVA